MTDDEKFDFLLDKGPDYARMAFAHLVAFAHRVRPLGDFAGQHVLTALFDAAFLDDDMHLHQKSNERGDGLGGIAMSLNHLGVGEDPEQQA